MGVSAAEPSGRQYSQSKLCIGRMDNLGKQSRESSRTWPSLTSPLASQTRGSSTPCGSYKCYFPSPESGVGTRLDRRLLLLGIRLDSASGPSPTLCNAVVPALSGASVVRDHNPCTCRMQAPSALVQAAAPTCVLPQVGPVRSPLCSSPLILKNLCFTEAA